MRTACAAPVAAEKGQPERSKIGGYRLLAPIGQGGFGRVFRARRESDGLEVALKLAEGPGACAALAREARAAAIWLGDERIVRVLEVSIPGMVALQGPSTDGSVAVSASPASEDEPAFIALELMYGGDLRKLLAAEGALTEKQAAQILQDVAAALAFAHQHGIVHGDVKPENILLTTDGRAKLGDFGLQTALDVGGVSLSSGLESRIAPAGTLRYAAPEVLEGKRPDPRADTYALGVVLFEMLTGRAPAGGDAPGDVRPSLGTRWDPIFRRCYTRLERRYESVGMLAREVAALCHDRPIRALGQLRDAAPTPWEAAVYTREIDRITRGRRIAGAAFGQRLAPGASPAGRKGPSQMPSSRPARRFYANSARARLIRAQENPIPVAIAVILGILLAIAGVGGRGWHGSPYAQHYTSRSAR